MLTRNRPLLLNNVCNLHCTHCYWWLNRKEEHDMSVEDWRKIIREVLNKRHIFITTLVGGEPTLRPDIIELFCKEMPKRICIVTNETFPLKRYDGLYFYCRLFLYTLAAQLAAVTIKACQ